MPELKHIEVRARAEHNLQNIDLTIPRDRLAGGDGPVGVGQVSLAFDTILRRRAAALRRELSAPTRASSST